jgi:hypothetical protein
MSGLLEQIMQAGGGSAVNMIAGKFGISPSQAQSAISALTPMIAGGFKDQAQQKGGLEAILGNVLSQNHVPVGANPEELARPGTTEAGNQVLGAIFGSKEVSREVASQASGQTGLPTDLLKKILPVLAMIAAGTMANKAQAGGLGGLLGGVLGNAVGGPMGGILGGALGGGAGGGALGGLASMIDMDKDGNPLNDIMGMLGKR